MPSYEVNRETCDRCGPTAYAAVAISFPVAGGFGLLTFCDHHARQYVPNVAGANVRELAQPDAETFDEMATPEAAR